ncbi:MAG: DNA replication/repair protein RecF [Rhodospirillaceae bacterium]|nr:DNA replication/repair protein RecF [Rhodospirillaceae bacterium]
MPSPPAFAVRRLALTAFRSWRSARLETPARCVVLTGPNGAGKTNLLEALSLLAPGRGLRRARMADLQRRGGPATGPEANWPETRWAVSAWLDTPEGLRRVGTGRDSTGDPDGESGAVPARRVLRIDGVPARGQGELSNLGAIVWLTPEMDGLFSGPAGERRRFLDRLVAGFLPRHATRLAAYEKAMRERNRLLRLPQTSGGSDPAWLDALEAAMAERGVAVAAARADFTARLAAACAGRVSAFPAPAVALDGGEDPMAAEEPALRAEEALKERLKASRAADADAGRALVGPHRADLVVHFTASGQAGEMPAAACSTGEQKALLIALVLAAARLQAVERGAAPMLLLDEVAAHLDRHRRAALFQEIEELGAQAWMTGTDAGMFDALRGRACFVAVADGALQVARMPDGTP